MNGEDTVTAVTDAAYGLMLGLGMGLYITHLIQRPIASAFMVGIGIGYGIHVFSNMADFSTKMGDKLAPDASDDGDDTHLDLEPEHVPLGVREKGRGETDISVSELSEDEEEREPARSAVFGGDQQ